MGPACRLASMATAILLATGSDLRAQSAPDAWQVTIAPYLLGAGLNGKTGIGRLDSDINLSASDVFSNLQFGFMGYFEVKKGNWGAGADIMWTALGSSTDKPLAADIDVDQGGFTFLAIRRLSRVLDLRGGVVVNTLRPRIWFKPPVDRRLSRTETWVDPVVGAKLHTPDTGGRWGLALIADVGGFGVGSDITFNVQPTALLRIAKGAGLAFGYRWIYVKYENAGNDDQRRLLYDMTTSGPLVGFVFRF